MRTAEDFLAKAFPDLRHTYPSYFERRATATGLNSNFQVRTATDIIGHFWERLVRDGEWSDRDLYLAVHEALSCDEKLTRTQLAKALARARAKAD